MHAFDVRFLVTSLQDDDLLRAIFQQQTGLPPRRMPRRAGRLSPGQAAMWAAPTDVTQGKADTAFGRLVMPGTRGLSIFWSL